MRIDLKPDMAVRKFKSKNGKTVAVFPCASLWCDNEIRMNPYPSVLKRATGYCTSCLQKKDPYGVIYRRLVASATFKGVTNDLTYNQFVAFTLIKNCVYCGKFIEWIKYSKSKEGTKPYNLDRKDSSLGYSIENCVVSCGRCNQVKNNFFSYEEFKLIGKVIAKIDRLKVNSNGNV